MNKQRKTYTREFKMIAIGLDETSGKPITQVVRELGPGQDTIAHWHYGGIASDRQILSQSHHIRCEITLRFLPMGYSQIAHAGCRLGGERFSPVY